MKTISFFAVLLFSTITLSSYAQKTAVTKETIKVWGNCGMCKTTIEKAAKKAGATTASWSEETHELQVSYTDKTSSKKIQEGIAAAGYDTQDVTGSDAAYKKLHGCCKYERKDAAATPVKEKCCSTEKCGATDAACKDKDCCKEKSCCKS